MSPLPALPSRAGLAAIGTQVHIGAVRTPDKSAVELVSGARRTYAELDERTNRLAHALLAQNLDRGDRVALWLGNCLEYLDVYLACAKAGLVVVQINIRHKPAEARYQLEDSGARVLVFGDAVAHYVEELDLGGDVVLVTTGSERVGGSVDFEGFLAAGADTMPPEPDDDDLLVIGYTSGTTGFPKGAELTHRSVKTLGQTNAITNRYTMASTQVFGLSLSFTAGIPAHVLTHLYVGGTTVLLEDWDTERLVAAIEEHRATFTILPSPPIPEFCEIVARDPRRLDSLVSLLHSSSKAPPEHLERLVGVIGPRLVEGWGMTENSGGLITATKVSDYAPPRPDIFSSVGTSAPDAAVRLVDEAGNVLPHDGDAVGQIIAHSASLARGYWNNPAASAATFQNGWYQTGDLGRIDPDGYVYLLDRRPDLIVSGGMNVYPSELERVILTLPGVDACAVVGAPHERWGQTPIAFVVAEPGVTADDVFALCAQQLAGYKKPSEVRIVAELPHNNSGKILKHQLRDQLLAESGAARPG
jgi:acyl-CoA synthetase (AMP-forming)/AMP-acid ligase II